MKKRIFAVICAVVMVFSLVSCSGGETDVASDVQMNKEGLPIVNEPVTLKVAVQKAPHLIDFKDMPLLQQLEEKTNVKIDWNQIPSESYWEKINLMLASGEYPDVLLCLLSDVHILELLQNDAIYKLDEYIDEYAPRWTEIFEEMPYARKAATAGDGHIYSLPGIRDEEAYWGFRDAIFINQDWLDALNLPMPTTTEELHATLKAFKDGDPNGNGEADEIPWSFVYGENISGELDIYGSFGLIDVPDKFVIKDGKIVYSPLQEENKAAVRYLHELYADGLIDQESFTQKHASLNAKIAAQPSLVGMYAAYGPVHDQELANYVPMPPVKAEGVEKPVMRKQTTQVMKGYFTMFKTNKYPEITMRWANELADKEFGIEALYGPLEKQADGTYTQKKLDSDSSLSTVPGTYGPFVTTDETLSKLVGNEGKEIRTSLYNVYKDYTTEVFPPVWYTAEQREVLTRYRTEINEYAKNTRADWIIKGTIDQEWDAFKGKVESMGLEHVLEVYQNAYDSFQAN
ncbi:MAG: extracellular solute-binding protein [Clostridia bacterium]|nr:extracellular solute-binding protein [Clostridia bacterium]